MLAPTLAAAMLARSARTKTPAELRTGFRSAWDEWVCIRTIHAGIDATFPGSALAVIAMIGMWQSDPLSARRISRVACANRPFPASAWSVPCSSVKPRRADQGMVNNPSSIEDEKISL
jgi:hypothetical protein